MPRLWRRSEVAGNRLLAAKASRLIHNLAIVNIDRYIMRCSKSCITVAADFRGFYVNAKDCYGIQ